MLELDSIAKSYNREKVLDEVSFVVPEGAITGLLGPNGAGKTTLIRIINRIIEQDKGYISFNKRMMTKENLHQMGYLPEERGLYRTMKVQDHAVFLGRLRGLSKKDALRRFNYWVDKFEIGDWRSKRIEELSKGMAQKVQFICTVLHDPEFLVLDEPFSGFDPINAELIRNEILEMKSKGKTILLSTHNMKSVEELCDKAVLIHHGRKVLEGEIEELRNQHKTGVYSITFSGNMIAFANALWAGYEIESKVVHSDHLFTVQLRMRGENELNDLLNALTPAVKIVGAQEVIPGMEEVFMQHIRKEGTHA